MTDDLNFHIEFLQGSFEEHQFGIESFEEHPSLRIEVKVTGGRSKVVGCLGVIVAVGDQELPGSLKVDERLSDLLQGSDSSRDVFNIEVDAADVFILFGFGNIFQDLIKPQYIS